MHPGNLRDGNFRRSEADKMITISDNLDHVFVKSFYGAILWILGLRLLMFPLAVQSFAAGAGPVEWGSSGVLEIRQDSLPPLDILLSTIFSAVGRIEVKPFSHVFVVDRT